MYHSLYSQGKPTARLKKALEYYDISYDSFKTIPRDIGLNLVLKYEGKDTFAIKPKTPPRPIIRKNRYNEIIPNLTELEKDSLWQLGQKAYKNFLASKPTFSQHIFPNAYVDIYEMDYGQFYFSPTDRQPVEDDFEHYEDIPEAGDDVFIPATVRNSFKRTYYLDSTGSILAIMIQAGQDINEGRKIYPDDRFHSNTTRLYLPINDSTHFVKIINLDKKNPHSHNAESTTEKDSDLINVYDEEAVLYRKGLVSSKGRKLQAPVLSWKNVLDQAEPAKKRGYMADAFHYYRSVNALLEYREYLDQKNRFLYPSAYSFISEPYRMD
jgi:hypothetical protein